MYDIGQLFSGATSLLWIRMTWAFIYAIFFVLFTQIETVLRIRLNWERTSSRLFWMFFRLTFGDSALLAGRLAGFCWTCITSFRLDFGLINRWILPSIRVTVWLLFGLLVCWLLFGWLACLFVLFKLRIGTTIFYPESYYYFYVMLDPLGVVRLLKIVSIRPASLPCVWYLRAWC